MRLAADQVPDPIAELATEMVSSADGLGYLVMVVIALPGYALDKAVVLARDRLIYSEKLDTYYV